MNNCLGKMILIVVLCLFGVSGCYIALYDLVNPQDESGKKYPFNKDAVKTWEDGRFQILRCTIEYGRLYEYGFSDYEEYDSEKNIEWVLSWCDSKQLIYLETDNRDAETGRRECWAIDRKTGKREKFLFPE